MNKELINILWHKAVLGYEEQHVSPDVLEEYTAIVVKECNRILCSDQFVHDKENMLEAKSTIKKYFGL